MSVPPDRMAARNPGTMKDPSKIMGLPKPAFYAIIVVGLILAYYIYKRSQSASAASLQTANAGTEPDTTNGVTAADIGGTPADNSFATQTDETALEEQIQQMQNSLAQLEASAGGGGAGITPPAGSPNPVPGGPPITQGQGPPASNPGTPTSTGTISLDQISYPGFGTGGGTPPPPQGVALPADMTLLSLGLVPAAPRGGTNVPN